MLVIFMAVTWETGTARRAHTIRCGFDDCRTEIAYDRSTLAIWVNYGIGVGDFRGDRLEDGHGMPCPYDGSRPLRLDSDLGVRSNHVS